MKTIQISVIAVLIVDGGPSLQLARGQQAGEIKRIDPATVSAAGSTHSAPPRETVTAVANTPIPNLPGKRLVSRVIDYPRVAAQSRTATPALVSSTPTSSRG
jgi:hypothetical protein